MVRRTFAGASQFTCTWPISEPGKRTVRYAMFSVGLPPCAAPVAATDTGAWPIRWSMMETSCGAKSQITFTSA